MHKNIQELIEFEKVEDCVEKLNLNQLEFQNSNSSSKDS